MQLENQEMSNTDIAVIGMGCRFPGANNYQQFWQNIEQGINSISEIPSERWEVEKYYSPNPQERKSISKWGGFIEEIDQFDAQFFGISPREAQRMDPQQRLMLELTWSCIEDAGYSPSQLSGSSVGVFIGVCNYDYDILQNGYKQDSDGHTGTGTWTCMIPNRISYFFNFHGPSIPVDTACSSSLVALHQAINALKEQECKTALVGGVSIFCTPTRYIQMSQLGMLSPQGQCKTFDQRADGYVRGEGAGVILLKPLAKAIEDEDHIYGVIRGSAVNHGGRARTLTSPNVYAQAQVLCKAYTKANVAPNTISYIEAHGTGTPLGDPIEINSLKRAFRQLHKQYHLSSVDKPYCGLGTVKTNIGHLEAAAGIAGVIKVLLAFKNQKLPKIVNFQQLNPRIEFKGSPFYLVCETQPWKQLKTEEGEIFPRRAGISSFGVGGVNAHVILEEAPVGIQNTLERAAQGASTKFKIQNEDPIERPYHLLALSAKNEQALAQLRHRYREFLTSNESVAIADVCYTANTGREHFNHRLAVVANSREQLVEQLADLTTHNSAQSNNKPPKIAFLFTGQGSQYINMGRQLYETQPRFRQTLEQCDEILRPYLEHSLLEILYPTQLGEQVSSLLNQTAYTQPALFAFEYALYQLWKSWGIEPDVVMGHSVGEYVAAVSAGVFSLEDGLKLIAQRGRLMQQLPSGGEMVSLMACEEQVREVIAPYHGRVALAAINGPESVVISGASEDIAAICQQLSAQGVKTKRLQVSHAFHSALMTPMLAEFEAIANQVTYNQAQIPLISNVTGQIADEQITTAQYWVNHVRQTVRFADCMQTLHKLGYEVFLEIGPLPILLGMGRQCLPESEGLWLPSLREGIPEWQQLLDSLAKLYAQGVNVNWSGFEQDYPRQKVALPTYPFQRQRYWIENTPRDQQQEAVSGENIQTPIERFLDQGNTQELVELVQKAGNFSPEQRKLLPEILSVLVKEHKQHHLPENLQDLCYELVWRLQPNVQQHSIGDYIPAPEQMSDRLKPQAQQLMSQHHQFGGEILVHLEALSIDYVITAFQEMGWNFQLGQSFNLVEIIQQLGVVSQYSRLMHRLLEMLVEVKLLERKGEQWDVVTVPKIQHPHSQINNILSQYPNATTQLTLLQRCGSHLAQVLRGECNPVQLLFPSGDLTTATQLYQDAPEAKVMNTLMQQAVSSVLENLPSGYKLRVLEIGAGTGGTTSYLLPLFNKEQTEYVFTDVSPFFLAQAQQKFQDFSFVKYQLLDIEQAVQPQGFDEHQYDLIVAANVLHATQDLHVTLQQVHKLLAPQGMLLLLEATVKARWVDLIFGLTDGWWRFGDLHLRPNYPLLTTHSWQKLLDEHNFKDTATIVPTYQGVISQQALILAQAATPQIKTELENWLIFADNQGIGQQLSELLRSQQKACILVFAGTEYKQITSQEFTINPGLPEDFQRLIQFMGTGEHKSKSLPSPQSLIPNPQLHGVVYLWNLDTVEANNLTLTDLEVASQTGCGGILSLVQSLIGKEFSPPPSLWLVTKGAQRVGVESTVVGVAQSPVWGLGKVIKDEHPEFHCTLVDLDPQENNNAQSLFAEICSHKPTPSETQIAFRDKQRYVNRLVRSQKIVKKSLHLKADGTYLITGGLGGIGLLVAQWLVEHGAKHLVLVGRSSPKEATQATLRRLEEAGCQVFIMQTDVSLEKDVTSLLTQIKTSMPQLRGIIHTAGVFEDRLLVDHQWQLFAKVFAPKVSGAWNLHSLTQDLPLDFFVLFSSVASILGSAGIANYAAANAFLDALANYRRSLDLPGLSINWGPWSMVGMAKTVGSRGEIQWASKGIKPIEPQQALSILENMLLQDASQVTVMQLNWSKFLQEFSRSSYSSFVSEIAQQLQELAGTLQHQNNLPQLLDQIKINSKEQNQSLLITYLSKQIAKALGITESALNIDEPLNKMGLDSLMGVELRNRLRTELEIDIPLTKFFDGVSVVGLTTFVSDQIFEANSTSKASVTPTTTSSKKNRIKGKL